MRIEFTVYGEAKTAGSKKAYPFQSKSTGRLGVRVTHDNPKTKDWMAMVGQVAAAHYDGELLKGPLRLFLQFVRVRPMGHFGTGRNAGTLKDSAPRYPTTRPDTVKLARAVEDALTKVIWHDDSQVVVHELRKSYGKQVCVKVVIETLDGKYH